MAGVEHELLELSIHRSLISAQCRKAGPRRPLVAYSVCTSRQWLSGSSSHRFSTLPSLASPARPRYGSLVPPYRCSTSCISLPHPAPQTLRVRAWTCLLLTWVLPLAPHYIPLTSVSWLWSGASLWCTLACTLLRLRAAKTVWKWRPSRASSRSVFLSGSMLSSATWHKKCGIFDIARRSCRRRAALVPSPRLSRHRSCNGFYVCVLSKVGGVGVPK